MKITDAQLRRISVEQEIKKSGKATPLEFVLRVMHDIHVPTLTRLEAAKIALPYVHKKMPTELQIEEKIPIDIKVEFLGEEDFDL